MRASSFVLALLFVFGVASAGAAPIGATTEFTSGLNPGANPAQVQAGPDGNLWFSDRSGAVGRITTAGVITEFSSGLNPGASDQSMAMGPDGNMWFSDNGTTRAVGMINPTTHVISEFSSGLNAGSSPQQGLITGPDGNVWFLDSGTTRAIGMINPTTHVISEFSSGLNPGSSPNASMVVGSDGALWFNDNGTTKAIGRIDPATHVISEFSSGMNAGANLGRITVGPDGNIWFGDKGTTPSIGTINPTTHVITQYTAGVNAGSLPGGIWTGSDGNVWFTDQGAIRAIGRTVTGAPAASVTPPSVTGSGGAGVTKACSGDVWSTWAGQQPSHSAYGFDGYQWLLDGSPIAGQTGPSYTPTPSDAGHQLSCTVTVTYPLLVVTVSATSAAVLVESAVDQLAGLIALINHFSPPLDPVLASDLVSEAQEASDKLAEGNQVHACNSLDLIAQRVLAEWGRDHSTLTLTQAQQLLAAVYAVDVSDAGCLSPASTLPAAEAAVVDLIGAINGVANSVLATDLRSKAAGVGRQAQQGDDSACSKLAELQRKITVAVPAKLSAAEAATLTTRVNAVGVKLGC